LVVKELRADVEGGLLLSQAMRRHPKIFDRLFVSMVEAGEAAGILDEVLDRVAYQIEKSTQIKRRVKGAMLYPTMVLVFATLVLVGLLMFLVPVFVKIFGQLGGELPTLTKYVVSASDVLRHKYYIIFPGLAAAFFGIRKYKKTEPGRKHWDRIKLKIPMKIGDFYEDEVDAAIQSLTSIVEPLMMILVGMMVGVIVIAMYLPMFKMLSLVK